MRRDLTGHACPRVDDEQILRRVVEDPHHQELAAVRRPAAHDVPRRRGDEDPLVATGGRRDHHVHVGGRARVRRERDVAPVRRRGVPREEPLDLPVGIDGERRDGSIRMTDVELVSLGPAPVGGADELAARAPAQAAQGAARERERRRRFAAARRDREGLERSGAAVGDERGDAGVRGERDDGAAGEAPGRMGNRRQPLADAKIGERSARRHRPGC